MVKGVYGSIMAMDLKEIEKLIKEALPDALVEHSRFSWRW